MNLTKALSPPTITAQVVRQNSDMSTEPAQSRAASAFAVFPARLGNVRRCSYSGVQRLVPYSLICVEDTLPSAYLVAEDGDSADFWILVLIFGDYGSRL